MEDSIRSTDGVEDALAIRGAAGGVDCYVVPDHTRPALRRYVEACADDGPGQLWTLPNGTVTRGLNGHETAFIASEVFEEDAYLASALCARDAVVVDVGANIGLFTMRVAGDGTAARVLAVEPVNALCDVLAANLSLHGLTDRVTLDRVALGASEGRAELRFSPFLAALSSCHADEREVLCRRASTVVKLRLPAVARQAGIDLDQASAWVSAQLRDELIPVPVRPLSALLRDHGVDRVDLLKIDVEGSELLVLEGIERRDWRQIDRVAVEVQDVDGRLEAVQQLLGSNGMAVRAATANVARTTPGAHMVYGQRDTRRREEPVRRSPGLVREAEVADEARRLQRAVRAAVPEGRPLLCAPAVLHAVREAGRGPDPRPDTKVMEAIVEPLATLLGVAPVHLAPGWATTVVDEGLRIET
jgi:FkbM family methyltransferase